jgi:gliding motility-associated-like protein
MKAILYLTAVLTFLFGISASQATHIVGGNLSYVYLGNGNYELILKVYRDCGPTNINQTPFDEFPPIGIYSQGVIIVNMTLSLAEAVVASLPIVLDNPCLALPPDVCVEEAIYTGQVWLPPSQVGYDLVYQRCCRNPSIVNIVLPDETGASFFAHIPGSNIAPEGNSSPQFDLFPPVAICAYTELEFDHGATDPDGDVLVYSFCDPVNGGDIFNPQPSPPLPPPYIPIVWEAGFSAQYPLTSDPAISIDSETGIITGTPTMPGQYVIGVCVSEYRDGVLMSTSNRDFQFNVVNCIQEIAAAIEPQQDPCGGMTISFESLSQGADSYYWDFGDGFGSSNMQDPTYTYPDTGMFIVTLVANPGYICADTATSLFAAYPPIQLTADYVLENCEGSDAFYSFSAGINEGLPLPYYSWTFGVGANPGSAGTESVTGVFLGPLEGTYPVSVTVMAGPCSSTQSLSISTPLEPFADAGPPDTLSCELPEVSLNAAGSGPEGFTYSWSSLDGNIESGENGLTPLVSQAGTYVLTVTDAATGCSVSSTTEVFFNGSGQILEENIVIPNIFSPNGDKVNDTFFLYEPGKEGENISNRLKTLEILIYNRWGNLVFESSGTQDALWDGRNNGGNVCSQGVYFYIIRYSAECNGTFSGERTGTITLVE